MGTGLLLSTEGQPDLEAAKGASTFSFPRRVARGTPYAVTVTRRPAHPPQTCTVADGAGLAGDPGARPVTVSCVTDTFPVGGTVSGFTGSGLVLSVRFAGGPAEDLAVWANGAFKFPTPGVAESRYEVTVKQQPGNPMQVCAVGAGTGLLEGPVTGIAVACVAARARGSRLRREPGPVHEGNGHRAARARGARAGRSRATR